MRRSFSGQFPCGYVLVLVLAFLTARGDDGSWNPDPYAAMTAFNRFGLGASPAISRWRRAIRAAFCSKRSARQGAGLVPAEGLSSTPQALQMFFAEQQQLRLARETAPRWRRRSR